MFNTGFSLRDSSFSVSLSRYMFFSAFTCQDFHSPANASFNDITIQTTTSLLFLYLIHNQPQIPSILDGYINFYNDKKNKSHGEKNFLVIGMA